MCLQIHFKNFASISQYLIIIIHMVQIIRILIILVLSLACLAKQRQMHQILQHTQTINYTFYHLHQSENDNKYGVLISIKQTDKNIDEVRLKVNADYEKLNTMLQPFGFTTNITSKYQELEQKAQIEWVLQILADSNVTSLGILLDQLVLLSKNNTNLFIWSVFKHGQEIVDKEIQLAIAREAADIKGKKICQDQIGWKFKELVFFDEVVIENERQEEVITGDYMKLMETIQQYEIQDQYETIYKCQIICERKNNIDLSVVQKKMKKNWQKIEKKKGNKKKMEKDQNIKVQSKGRRKQK